jgi:threonine dehydratase
MTFPDSTTVATDLVSIDEIRSAATRVAAYAVRTPLLPPPLGDGWAGLYLKPEMLQPIGAFKIRGAVNAIAALDPDVRRRGVVTHSSGNHAQAVAFAARAFGIAAHIVIPDVAPARKVAATRALGAEVELGPMAERLSRTEHIAATTGMTLIPPFDHRDVIAGQGTIGLEIAEDLGRLPEPVTAVLVPVSGGGLISGIAAALAALAPGVAVIGAEPELAGDAAESFRVGHRVAWGSVDTVRTSADGLRVPEIGALPWEHIRRQVAGIVTVTEDEIAAAVARLALDARLVTEPSGAVTAAAHLFHSGELPAGGHVAVLSGGNIDPALLASLLSSAAQPA